MIFENTVILSEKRIPSGVAGLYPESLCLGGRNVQEVDFVRCQHHIPSVELVKVPTGIYSRIKCMNIVRPENQPVYSCNSIEQKSL